MFVYLYLRMWFEVILDFWEFLMIYDLIFMILRKNGKLCVIKNF